MTSAFESVDDALLRRLAEGHPAARDLRRLKRERAGQSLDGGYDYLKLARMAYYVHKDSYRAEVARHARALRADQ